MTDQLSPETIARLRELEAKATPGPWEPSHALRLDGGFAVVGPDESGSRGPTICFRGPWEARAAESDANAALIAELRNAAPALLAAAASVGELQVAVMDANAAAAMAQADAIRQRPRAEATERAPEQAAGWQPIESAPKDGTHVLVLDAHAPNVPPTTVHWFNGGWHLSVNQRGEFSEYIWGTPSHWMPLPKPPAIQARDETGC